MRGSQCTGKFTELAMKQAWCASVCSASAFAASLVGTDGHGRAQHHFDEAAAAGVGFHHAFGDIAIGSHHDFGGRGQMQIRQHVARRQRGNQHVFGIVARRRHEMRHRTIRPAPACRDTRISWLRS
jgi:hypothetical protein